MPLEVPHGMDYVNDVSMPDPFLCLDTDLDDVSDVIRGNWTCQNNVPQTDLSTWPDMSGADSRQAVDPLLSFGHLNHSPQHHADPNSYREIGSIVSLLQEGDHMFDGTQNYRNFVNEPLHSDQSALPTASVTHHDAMNSPNYAPTSMAASLFSNSQNQHIQQFVKSSPQGNDVPMEGMDTTYVVKEERWPSELTGAGHDTKQELLNLIATLTPDEVNRLRSSRSSSTAPRERHPMVVGVATKMPIACKGVEMVPPTRRGSEAGSILLSPGTTCSSNDVTYDSDTDVDIGSAFKRGPRTERRTAHNLIEKKYRCSINDRIQSLKMMLSGEDGKLSKSSTLRKAIEHISDLRRENEQLHNEVERLRQMLKQNGIDDANPAGLLPPSCVVSNPMNNPPLSPVPDEFSTASSRVKRSRAMVDKSRVTMLAFMFALVIWNPITLFIDHSSPSPSATSEGIFHSVMPGRSLQQADTVPFDIGETETIWWRDSIVRPCFVWSVNVFIVFCFLTRVLVYGEPVADAKSSSWTLFLNTRSAAGRFIERGNYYEASRQLRECLRVLERPIPTAGFDELISVIWQVIRHLLNSVWIGRWFSRRRRSAAKPVTVVCASHAHTALIYHQLHQLHLIGVENMGDGLTGLNYALSAVNLAESAGCSRDGLSHAHRADIYLNAALRVRITLPSFIGVPLCLYFMRRARSHVRRSEGAFDGIAWIFDPLSRKFLSSPHLADMLQDKHHTLFPFITSSPSIRPLERLTAAFKMELLKSLLAELSNPVTSSSSRFDAVSHLLLTICTAIPNKATPDSSTLSEETPNTEGDELCTWWTHVFTCALYWKHGDNANAHKHYTLVRNCPRQLLNSNLSLALGHAFCSRKLCVDDRGNRHFTEVVWAHATRSYSFLQRIDPDKAYARISPAAKPIHEMVRCLSLEWLLMSVVDVWQSQMSINKPYWEQPPVAPLRQLYERAFARFNTLARTNHDAKSKVVLFELASRMLNAANPVSTWNCLVRISRHERVDSWISRGMGILCSPSLPTKYPRLSHAFHIDILRKLHSDMSTFTITP